ncbi:MULTISPECIES: hypothetical protein [unclassified Bradyrhizobium]|nr:MULTISPECIES: hypothetical protein [unclassified Bradyrhizobium]MDA9448490.1 hypothetical protein [Bradyrhizobium sp. CCBAU 21360]MDA9455122.1 hypothetical protein [Bradyrhizobium sp. CCBAU 21359]MDA9515624.1 hypothetical protein [Bradyrhizobium sp. CCBAU 11430]
MRSSPVSHYADAIRSIKAYCEDPRRDFEVLDSAAAALKTKSESKEFKPSQQEDAKRCIEVIGRFTESVNVFGARSAPLLQAPPFELCNINGVSVSIQPDLIVGTAFPPPAKEAIGAVFIRLQKAPDPDACKTEETKVIRQEYRVELAKYMLVLGWMNFKDCGLSEGQIDTKKMSVWDIRLKESISFPSDRVSRIKRIEAACGQIVRLWDTIEAKPGDYAKD